MKAKLLLAAVAALLCACGTQKPVLFLVGDSTMADKTELEASPERGWGQLFPTYIDTTKVSLQNHAKNGRSTRSFITEGRWQVVTDRMKRGDAVIIEFGHNDTKTDTARHSTPEQYAENLARMIDEAQAKGATVVLATSIVRRKFDDEGRVVNTHGEYPDVMRQLAAEKHVPLLDLNRTSEAWLQELGPEASRACYMNVAPGACAKYPEGRADDTHLQESGALAIGRQAAALIREQHVEPICRWLIDEPQEARYTIRTDIK